MAKDLEPTALEPLISAVQNAQIAPDTTSSDLRAQCEKASSAVREPKSAKALAALYGVSDRTLQDWFKTICTAYIWLPLTDLKIGSSNKTRYTVLCQELIAQYHDAAKTLSTDEWIKTIRAAHPEQGSFPEPEAELVEAHPDHESDMVPYQPQQGEPERFTPPARKLRRFVSTAAFVSTAKQHTETALDVTAKQFPLAHRCPRQPDGARRAEIRTHPLSGKVWDGSYRDGGFGRNLSKKIRTGRSHSTASSWLVLIALLTLLSVALALPRLLVTVKLFSAPTERKVTLPP